MYHINDIEKYKGYSLKVAEENLNDLDDGEFYYHEIIGLEIYEGDNLIGTIKEILFQPGANDVWVVAARENVIRFYHIPPVVLNVDIPNKRGCRTLRRVRR